jgi:hypothetical protein
MKKCVVAESKSNYFRSELTILCGNLHRPINLILHAGSPKTGSSSLQSYFFQHREALLDRGCLYPHSDNTDSLKNPKPKHQWLVINHLSCNVDKLMRNLTRIIGDIRPDTHTVILSTEGLYNHWWDFSHASKQLFGVLGEFFQIRWWVWLSDPHTFVRRYYKQVLKNPKFNGAPACYGTDLTIEEFIKDKWFLQRLDYVGYIRDVESYVGPVVDAMPYDQEIISVALQKLGITDIDHSHKRENKSLSNTASEILRITNRHPLRIQDKARVVELVRQIDSILDVADEDKLSVEMADKVSKLTDTGIAILEQRYGQKFGLRPSIKVDNT